VCGTPVLVCGHNDSDYTNDKLKIAIILPLFLDFEEMAHMFPIEQDLCRYFKKG
jgi:hypothetical protein